MYADKQEELTESKFANKQESDISHSSENKQSFNLPDLGLSSALGLFTPEFNSGEEEQPVRKPNKKKKPKRGFRQG
ncbi:MAG: hypothetical protein PHY27_05630 [Parabacteroides sp.]|jgi:hypothetical protein|uniref:hypothetical protein n=1 Tax=Macellibacteroides sp. TaxID=2014584 RepID=UPI002A15F90F|nr:hypothetical protein [Parabacteroides sp.]